MRRLECIPTQVADVAFVPADAPLSPDPPAPAAGGGLRLVAGAGAGAGARAGGGVGAAAAATAPERAVELVRFCDTVLEREAYLVWSVMPVLHETGGAGPNELMRLHLRLRSPPPVAAVVEHLARLSSSPAPLLHWPAAALALAPDACFHKTFEYLWTRWADVTAAERGALARMPCVPVGDTLVKASRVFCRAAADFAPFIYELPRALAAHEPLLRALGAKDAPQARDLLAFLHELAGECAGRPLNPNEVAAVLRVLQALAELPGGLAAGEAGGAGGDLLVPDVGGLLVRARDCFVCSDRALLRRVDCRLIHLAHPGLSAGACGGMRLALLRDSLDERLSDAGNMLLSPSAEEAALTARLHAPGLARALAALIRDPALRAEGIAAELGRLRVAMARSLRTRLYLRGAGGGGAGGDMDVSAAGGAGEEVLYFVDGKNGRLLVSEERPVGVSAMDVVAAGINHVLDGRLAPHLLAVCV